MAHSTVYAAAERALAERTYAAAPPPAPPNPVDAFARDPAALAALHAAAVCEQQEHAAVYSKTYKDDPQQQTLFASLVAVVQHNLSALAPGAAMPKPSAPPLEVEMQPIGAHACTSATFVAPAAPAGAAQELEYEMSDAILFYFDFYVRTQLQNAVVRVPIYGAALLVFTLCAVIVL